MVVPLGPGKFYGTSLPRPRIYTDVKYSESRVDPPVPVTDSLLSWASEAHWSMGGLCHKRLRLQGRIEGSVSKLRRGSDSYAGNLSSVTVADDPVPPEIPRDSPPPAPMADKRRRISDLNVEEEEEVEIEIERRGRVRRRRLVKKLDDDFDRVASENSRVVVDEDGDDDVAVAEVVNKVKSRGSKVNSKKSSSSSRAESGAVKHRSSPRLKSK